MSSSSFLVRLRARRRQDGAVSLQLPQDHWHAGDPRMLDGALALQADPLPQPRRPVDARRALSAVPEVDVRDGVVDLRSGARTAGALRTVTAQMPAVQVLPVAEPTAMPAVPVQHACSETSTWLG